MRPWGEILQGVLMEHGVWAMLFIAALVVGHVWIARLHSGRLADRQREIDRLADDNRAYRDLFTQIVRDNMHGREENKQ